MPLVVATMHFPCNRGIKRAPSPKSASACLTTVVFESSQSSL